MGTSGGSRRQRVYYYHSSELYYSIILQPYYSMNAKNGLSCQTHFIRNPPLKMELKRSETNSGALLKLQIWGYYSIAPFHNTSQESNSPSYKQKCWISSSAYKIWLPTAQGALLMLRQTSVRSWLSLLPATRRTISPRPVGQPWQTEADWGGQKERNRPGGNKWKSFDLFISSETH